MDFEKARNFPSAQTTMSTGRHRNREVPRNGNWAMISMPVVPSCRLRKKKIVEMEFAGMAKQLMSGKNPIDWKTVAKWERLTDHPSVVLERPIEQGGQPASGAWQPDQEDHQLQ